MPKMTIPEIIEELEKELTFVKKWLKEDPGNMQGFLEGKRNTLQDIIQRLKNYERP